MYVTMDSIISSYPLQWTCLEFNFGKDSDFSKTERVGDTIFSPNTTSHRGLFAKLTEIKSTDKVKQKISKYPRPCGLS